MSTRSPFSKGPFLQSGRLLQQTECIAVILKHIELFLDINRTSTSPPLLCAPEPKAQGSKISMSSTKFMFFRPIGNKMAALASDWLRHFLLLLWNCWTEFNKIWHDRKQDLNVLYQVCVLRVDPKNKMATLACDWLIHFSSSSLKPLNGIQRNLTRSKIPTSSTKFAWPVQVYSTVIIGEDIGELSVLNCVKIVHLLFLESKYSFRESEFEVPTFPWKIEN